LTLSCNSRANLDYDTIKSFKDNGLRLFLVGYESGNDETLTRIKKGVTMDEMRRFTKDCHRAGVVIHGTFILGLPVETKETIENTIRFAQELDVFSIQVSLAAPYPGTELFEMARQNGWFVKKDKTDLVEEDGFQQSSLEYPGLGKEEIFESVERFYHRYYLRPRPILRIIRTMLEDKDVCVRATNSSKAWPNAAATWKRRKQAQPRDEPAIGARTATSEFTRIATALPPGSRKRVVDNSLLRPKPSGAIVTLPEQ